MARPTSQRQAAGSNGTNAQAGARVSVALCRRKVAAVVRRPAGRLERWCAGVTVKGRQRVCLGTGVVAPQQAGAGSLQPPGRRIRQLDSQVQQPLALDVVVALGRLSGSPGVGRGGQLEIVAQAGVIRHIQWLSIRSSHERPRCLAMNDQPPRGANIGGQRFAHQLVTKAERGGALFEQPALNPLFEVAQQLERGALQNGRQQIEIRCRA